LRVVLGSALIAFGIYQWLTRRGHTESPRWMRSFTTLTPARAALIGLVLVVIRLEVLVMCALAGLAIGGSGLGVAAQWISAAIFVALAASTVALPILAYAAAGHRRLEEPMERLKDWMERNNAALLAAILVLIGLVVLYHGVAALY
jgi:hypothetical protein